MRRIYLLIFIVILASCNNEDLNIQGYWRFGGQMLKITTDTIINYPSKNKLVYFRNKNEIFISKIDYFETKIEDLESEEVDTIKYPYLFGVLKSKFDSIYIESNTFYSGLSCRFYKMETYKNYDFKKIQFYLFLGGKFGLNIEISNNGEFWISSTKDQSKETFNGFIPKSKLIELEYAISLINFDNLKYSYKHDSNYGDGEIASFVIYINGKKYKSRNVEWGFIEDYSPLQVNMREMILLIYKDRLKYKKVQKRFYESYLYNQHSLYDSIRYISMFDSLKYRLPKYNKKALRNLFLKNHLIDDLNTLYYIKIDSFGNINRFEYKDKQIDDLDFINGLKQIKDTRPALYDGNPVDVEFCDGF